MLIKASQSQTVLVWLQEKYKGKQSERGGTPAPAPGAASAAPAPAAGDPALVASLEAQVNQQGDKVRQLKTSKAEKALVDVEVKLLLDLKKKLSLASGEPVSLPSGKKGKKK